MNLKAVLFDFDGTIADTLPEVFNSFNDVFMYYEGKHLTGKEIIQLFGPTEDEIILDFLQNKQLADEAIERYYTTYQKAHSSIMKSSNEIISMLKLLIDKKLRLGIITGKSRRGLDISLNELGIASMFEATVAGNEVQHPKPDPEGILKTMEMMNLKKNEVIFVGDSNADIKAGKAANILTVGVHWLSTVQSSSFEIEPDYYITKTVDFMKFVEEHI
ncbi:HAD family hydrolase [Chengkuizengella axinellae]|uniref:HAD family hydrolase n=1 Tax=Chengkuizengella axinellae TaxID=3064388 RepID=A0ABT9IVZ0_9BACL|nr:HAD family hydrolase [Chengkuizengella sp. 2205SS18-9]MDP5272955.1 HAD family hydrolase [Chengkuizengella sp. 2205SS18-9]